MKKFLIIFLAVFFCGCGVGDLKTEDSSKSGPAEIVNKPEVVADNILIIVGEGGPSGSMFVHSALTYKDENGGTIYEVKNGDEFIAAVKDFVSKYGKITHLEYFGHGNQVGLYVNQQPNVNGGLYANDVDQNKSYIAASIYELDNDIFVEGASIKVNGCNVASGYPEKETLGQRIANYFDAEVLAPKGPTEFSSSADSVDPIPNSNYLSPDFNGKVYMVPTYEEQGFVTIAPQKKNGGEFEDVRSGQSFEEGVSGIMKRGLNLHFEKGKFQPYKNITYGEAREFCRTALGENLQKVWGAGFGEDTLVPKTEDKCKISEKLKDEKIRNLKALKMLVNAYGVEIGYTSPWYDSYIWWANQNNILTADFVTKKWYTRGEMAELTWNFVKKF